jgi:sugar phosphate isomerase/epimerase
MKYAVFTVGTPEYNLEETLSKLKEFGYDGVEWRINEISKNINETETPSYWGYNRSTVDIETIEAKAENLKALSEKYGIEICALATYLGPQNLEKVDRVLRAANKMGCPKIRVNAPGYNETENYNLTLKRTIEQLKTLEILAKKYNVKINLEMHMGTIIPSASAAYRLVSNFDSKYIGVIYDTGNVIYEGYEQYKMALEILGEYLDHVHIKNARWVEKEKLEDGTVVWEAQWAPMSKGQANFKEVGKALKSVGYDGYLSFEDFSNEETTDDKLKFGLKYIKNFV